MKKYTLHQLFWGRALLAFVALVMLAACEPLSLTAVGVGGSAAVSHTLGGITYRTFTAPMPRVKTASLNALGKMGIKVAGTEKVESGELVRAAANDRSIEITLEALSPNATRMKVVARNCGLFFDSATATEIILQTERLLGSA